MKFIFVFIFYLIFQFSNCNENSFESYAKNNFKEFLKSEKFNNPSSSQNSNNLMQQFYNLTDYYNNMVAASPYKPNQTHQIYAGYLQVGTNSVNTNYSTGNESLIFYQLFTANGQTLQNNNPKTNLILWIQGGPGCSDLVSSHLELGPYYVQQNQTSQSYYLLENPYTWNLENHILFIDQPIGVGYSILIGDNAQMPDNSNQSAEAIENILISFFANSNFTTLAQNPFFIFGESYAGHFIPPLAVRLINNSNTNHINLKGIGIGDGWVDNFYQSQGIAQYFYAAGTIAKSQLTNLKFIEAQELELMMQNNYYDLELCTNISNNEDNILIPETLIANDLLNYKIYQLYPKQSLLATWLATENVTQTFGSPGNYSKTNNQFSICGAQKTVGFLADYSETQVPNINFILQHIPVMIYQGQLDGNVPDTTTYGWMNAINWSGIQAFRQTTKQFLKINNTVVGKYKQSGNLTFCIINNAGHMVPLDNPEAALTMLNFYFQSYSSQ